MASSISLLGWPNLIEEAIHLFCRKHRRNALGQLRRGNKARGAFLQTAFANAVLKKGAQRCELPRDGTFLQALIVQMRNELADQSVRDARERGRPRARRRKISHKLVQ